MIQFTAYGVPAPKGSTRAFIRPGMRFPVVTEDNRHTRPWAAIVKGAAIDAVKGTSIVFPAGPVKTSLVFLMPRPQSLPKKVIHHTKKPDLDKLVRAVKDALTGIIWTDDAQVVSVSAAKYYAKDAEMPGVMVAVEEYVNENQLRLAASL